MRRKLGGGLLRQLLLTAALIVLAIVVVRLTATEAWQAGMVGSQATPTARLSALPAPTARTGVGGGLPRIPTPRSDETMARLAYARLPLEAQALIPLIERGGPFPYDQDGITFQNRERLLPARPGGYYKEYTVPTPGAATRGARRIVRGAEGELYYTGDHYASFSRVVP